MKYNTPDKLFKAICDPIRNKKNTTDLINHQDIPEAMEECFDIVQKETKEKYCVKNIVNGENILVTDGLNEPIQNLKVLWENLFHDQCILTGEAVEVFSSAANREAEGGIEILGGEVGVSYFECQADKSALFGFFHQCEKHAPCVSLPLVGGVRGNV